MLQLGRRKSVGQVEIKYRWARPPLSSSVRIDGSFKKPVEALQIGATYRALLILNSDVRPAGLSNRRPAPCVGRPGLAAEPRPVLCPAACFPAPACGRTPAPSNEQLDSDNHRVRFRTTTASRQQANLPDGAHGRVRQQSPSDQTAGIHPRSSRRAMIASAAASGVSASVSSNRSGFGGGS